MNQLPDPNLVAGIIREVAITEILPRYQSLAATDIETKSSGEPVTVADEESERCLTERLGELLPGACFIGEEAAERNPQLLNTINGDDPVWIIDPIDGTKNFAVARPPFVVIVALCHRGETLMGWIYEPLEERMAFAKKGDGAFINGKQVRVAEVGSIKQMQGYCAENFIPDNLKTAIDSLREDYADLSNPQCFGYEYLELISGRQGFSLIGRLYPWDLAAGVLLYKEAGGVAAFTDGRGYSPRISDGVLLLAPTVESWDNINRILEMH